MCCPAHGMSELLLPTPPPSTLPGPVWGGLARVVTLPPCRSCAFPPRVTPLGLCCPLSSPRGSAALSLWRGAVVRGCPSAWTSLLGRVSLPALAPSLNVLALPFRPLPDCVGVHRASVCRGGRGEGCASPLGASLAALSPSAREVGLGVRASLARGCEASRVMLCVPLSPRAPSLCTCAGGLGRGEGGEGGGPDRKCLPLLLPPCSPLPRLPPRGPPRSPASPLPPGPAPSPARRRTPRG